MKKSNSKTTNNYSYMHIVNRAGRTVVVCLMTLCLTAAMFNFAGMDAYAASSPFKSISYTHNSRFKNDLILNGVDVSYFQSEKSNWKTAKSKGVDFAILRVSYSACTTAKYFYYKNNDSKFSTHYKKAKAQGLLIGAYHFSQARTVSEARKEATYAVSRLKELGIGPKDLDMPVYMDYEYSPYKSANRVKGISKAKATACVNAFCDVIRRNGYQPGVYASTSFYDNQLNVAAFEPDIDIWCAQYNYRNTSGTNYNKWQYSSTGTVKGILHTNTGKVGWTDVNFWYINKKTTGDALLKIYGAVTYKNSKTIPALKVYKGGTLLKENTDYTLKVLENNGKTAYAYVRGIGAYKGYAIVPLKFNSSYIDYIGLKSGMVSNHKSSSSTKKLSASAPAADQEIEAENAWEDPAEETIDEAADAAEDAEAVGAAEQAAGEVCPEEVSAQDAGSNQDAGAIEENAEDMPVSGQDTAVTEAATADDAEETPAEAAQGSTEEPAEVCSEELTDEEYTFGSISEEAATASVTKSKLTGNYKILSKSIGDIPAGTTAETFLRGLDTDTSKYKLDVINNKGVSQGNSTVLKTGMLLGVYDKKGNMVGNAELRVTGSRLSGLSNHIEYNIKQATTDSLTADKGSFKIKVKKMDSSDSSGYEVRYSTSSYMKKAVTKTISKKSSSVSKTIKGLKSGKKYYVQVRNVKTVGGTRYYSAWSTYKGVKVL